MQTNQVYHPLSEAAMEHDRVLSRLNQWWKDRLSDPWAEYRARLLSRSFPYYTLTELEDLAQLLLAKEEREVLLQKSTSDQQHIRMSEHACRCFEWTALAIARIRYQFTFGPTSRTFASFPGALSRRNRDPEHPYGQVCLVFPYDLRILEQGAITYYACPSDRTVVKTDAKRAVNQNQFPEALLVRGEERLRVLAEAEWEPPAILRGTDYEVQQEPGTRREGQSTLSASH